MFLKITQYKTKGGLYKHAKIVESYWDRGTCRQKTLKNIGPIKTKEDEMKARNLLEKMKKGEKLVVLDEVDHDKIREYGIIYASQKLWEKFGMEKIIEETFKKRRPKFNMFDSLFLLTVSRLYGLSSDLDTYDWIKDKAHYPTNVQLHHLYRALDLLEQEKGSFEKLLLKQLKKKKNLKTDIVFYDLTSAYFEGKGPKKAEYGYNRDKKRGKKQIVLGLVLCDGYPIAHRIWPGKTKDSSTLKQAVHDLKKRFRIKKVILVADRGLIIETNLEELENNEYDYIIATKRRKDNFVKDLITQEIEEGAKVVKEVKTKVNGKEKVRSYILCFNKETQESESENLKKTIEKCEAKLKKIKSESDGKNRKKIDNIVKKELKSRSKFFKWSFRNRAFTYSLKKDVWDYENAIAGKFLLVTTSGLKPEKVVESYKELKFIEQTFHEMKSIINLRPINHSTDIRVEGHAFICVLSILTRRFMSKTLGEANEIIKELKEIKAVENIIGDEKYCFMTKLTNRQKEIFKKLDVEEPIKYL